MRYRAATDPNDRKTGPMSLIVDRPSASTDEPAPVNRLGVLSISFSTVVMILAIARHPTKATLIGAPIVHALTIVTNVYLVRLASTRKDGFWDVARCLLNGPLTFAAIALTGGYPSPVWMAAYQAVMGSTREPRRTSVLVACWIIACQLAAYAAVGTQPGDDSGILSRGALLLTLSLFFRIVLQAEQEHHASAENAARAAERAKAAKAEAEARFRLAEQSTTHSKMASLGLLAASVAHEINNPINTVINSAQIILDGDADHGGGAPHFQRLIITEGERIARVVSNLLQFARGGSDEYGPTNLLRVIEKTLMLIQHQLEVDNIAVEVKIGEELPHVHARMEELQQVFLNLLTNARYALIERCRANPSHRAVITISAVESVGPAGTPTVVTRVRDNGTGIPHEHLEHIFDPFFTTKPKEEGTGLGLSVCFRILQEHRGRIAVESHPGLDTTFVLTLPAINDSNLINSTGTNWQAVRY